MKKLGVAKEQDEEWHRTHQTLSEQRSRGTKAVNPLSVGGGFLAWCTEQGWLVKRGTQYVATPEGVRELHKRFGIEV